MFWVFLNYVGVSYGVNKYLFFKSSYTFGENYQYQKPLSIKFILNYNIPMHCHNEMDTVHQNWSEFA